MRGVTNHFLSFILDKYFVVQDFKGVFSSNNVDCKIASLPKFSIICNLSEYGEYGSHFVTIIAFKDFLFYIDPLGIPCFVQSLCEFLKLCNRKIFYNTKPIQNINDSYCGLYCLLFVLYYDSRCKYSGKLTFYSETEKNAKKCISMIKKLILHME